MSPVTVEVTPASRRPQVHTSCRVFLVWALLDAFYLQTPTYDTILFRLFYLVLPHCAAVSVTLLAALLRARLSFRLTFAFLGKCNHEPSVRRCAGEIPPGPDVHGSHGPPLSAL